MINASIFVWKLCGFACASPSILTRICKVVEKDSFKKWKYQDWLENHLHTAYNFHDRSLISKEFLKFHANLNRQYMWNKPRYSIVRIKKYTHFRYSKKLLKHISKIQNFNPKGMTKNPFLLLSWKQIAQRKSIFYSKCEKAV